jgi:N-acetylglucosamine-6-phosphate deacetylase
VPAGAEVIDCRGMILIPGLIDLHLHGGGGFDVAVPGGLDGAARFHGAHGTTSMVPTLGPDTVPVLKEKLAALAAGYRGLDPDPRPEILGLHLEGPFLNAKRGGAFEAGALIGPDPALIPPLSEAAGGTLRLMTLAPELPGGQACIAALLARGILPALGHSDAGYGEAQAAFSAGVRHVTHIFNAMRGIHHREPGCAAAALLHREVTVEVVADGHHLHDATVEMIYRLKGAEQMILVSDAVPLAGAPRSSFVMGGERVTVRDGKTTNESGRLAGSLLTLAAALRRVVQHGAIPFAEALRMVTINPARLLGVSERKGVLRAGADADVLIVNPSLDLHAVYIGGRAASDPAVGADSLEKGRQTG